MINADISNIWGDISLRDLLGLEDRILEAHKALYTGIEKGSPLSAWMDLPNELPHELTKKANLIRMDSDVLVVIGDNEATRGIRAMIELLQGPHRNLGKGLGDPMILFTGDSRCPLHWNELTHLLEGRDYSLCIIAGEDMSTETAVALRNLKWMLCRKYGTDYAMDRIYAVTDPQQGALRRMAQAENWKTFDLPVQKLSLLCPGCWLPLAVAGIDVENLLRIARNVRETYSLGSFEDNPAWLYAAAQKLMKNSGKTAQLLTFFEPGMAAFGKWWQQLYSEDAESSCPGMAPLAMQLSADAAAVQQLIQNGCPSPFETLIHFDPPEKKIVIAQDIAALDGLEDLAGKTLAEIQENAFFRLQEEHADAGTAVLALNCPQLSQETLVELVWFFQMSRALELGM